MRHAWLVLLLAVTSAAWAQNGAEVYKTHCASCHSSAAARAPSKAALQTMSLAQVLDALRTGAMKNVGSTLTPRERFAVAIYLGARARHGTPLAARARCSVDAPPFRFAASGATWMGWSPGRGNTRFQPAAAAGMTAADVPKLRLKWAFALGDETDARSAPAVDGGRIFLGTDGGAVYSLDARSGCVYWRAQVAGGIRSALVIGPTGDGQPVAVYFGAGKDAYALAAATGKQLWRVPVATHVAAITTAAPLLHRGVLYFSVSSFEEELAPMPTYPCCTFRGSVVALDAATGKRLWRAYTIAEAPRPTQKNKAGTQMYGPSGAAVWSTPTFDPRRDAIYVATGDNYSHPATATSDAVLAFDARTGRRLWSRQVTQGDASNAACGLPGSANCPPPAGHDYDFGQPPMLVTLPGGRQELVLAQKSGVAYALNPGRRGAILWQTRVGRGGALGGAMWGSAADGQHLYVAESGLAFQGIVRDKTVPGGYRLVPNPNQGGGLFALNLKTGEQVWAAAPVLDCGKRAGCSPAQSQAVTVISGVVFSGSRDGHIRAYATANGKLLWDYDTARAFPTVNGPPGHGGSLDGPGPVVAGGMLYVTSGYAQFGGMPGNVLLAFSAPGR
ncbi:MAG: PQQ-binding-like beta-propeller repeat protein [Terriglobales bacterium]